MVLRGGDGCGKIKINACLINGLAPSGSLDSLAVADIDGDGRIEMVTGGGSDGGKGALLWYRPGTFERGLIAQGHFHVGVALEDLDGDGRLEIVCGRRLYRKVGAEDLFEEEI